MAACATQIHLDPRLSLRNPLLWLRLLGIQKVSITFAPNFFLAAAIKALETRTERLDIDLSNLRLVISGGEANRVSTGIAFNNAVKTLGTNRNVLCPAFGMTETCAGSIYNLEFPELEIRNRLEFCSVGTSTISLRYLITNDNGLACATGQAGDLQLKGPAIFKNYHNNSGATEAAFTKYGYLKTGDTGYMDADGNLVLVGRTKDSIIINGVKYFSSDLEAVVEEAASEYLVPSYTTVFPIRSEGDDTEDVVVTFVASSTIPSDPMHVDPQDTSCDATLYDALEKIASTIFLHCSKKPRNIIPLPRDYLQRTSLGKLSRSAIKLAFEDGRFRNNDEDTRYRISRHRATTRRVPVSDMEKELAKVFASEFDLDIGEVGVDTSLVDMGLDSIRLLRLKGHLQQQLGLNDVRIGTLLANPTIEKLANALSINNVVKEYDPVIVLQSGKSTAAPVWFIHPGLGEVLVFLNISNYFAGRRVFAVRAPGFNAGEKMFKSIDEMTK